MPTKQEYNGYTNYETWLCALWLDNDQGQQGMMSDKASELAEEIDPHNADDVERVTQEMAEYIEQLVDDWRELFNLPNACLFTDFVNAGLREVDYHDIAKSQLSDALAECAESLNALDEEEKEAQ